MTPAEVRALTVEEYRAFDTYRVQAMKSLEK